MDSSRIAEKLGVRPETISRWENGKEPIGPANEKLLTAARIKKFCRPTNFDATKLRHFGLEQPVSMAEALRRSVEWYLTAR